MPERLKNQHTAKKRREEKRKLLKRRGISRRRVKKSQVSTQPVSVATKQLPSQVQQKIYKLILTKGPEDENERALWISSIENVLGKTRIEARRIIFHAEHYDDDEKPTLFSGSMEEIAALKSRLARSFRDATKIKE